MPIWGAANFIVPLFHCRETVLGPFLQPGQAFLSSYYAGAAVLVLAVCALRLTRDRRVWALTILALFGILMAWGDNGFLYPLVRRLVPALGCRLSRIGRVVAGRGHVRLHDAAGREVELARRGFDHFVR